MDPTNPMRPGSWTSRRRTARVLCLASVLALCLGGYTSRPFPLEVAKGTTFLILLGDEEHVGYQSAVSRAYGFHDFQRGELVFTAHVNSIIKIPLITRYVFRTIPDPATPAGIEHNVVDGVSSFQVYALVDMPTWAANGSHTLTVERRFGADPATGDPCVFEGEQPDFPSGIEIGVLHTGGRTYEPTPSESFVKDIPLLAGMDSTLLMNHYYPQPSLVIRWSDASPFPHAARLVLTYPAAKVRILDLHEHGVRGQASLTQWLDDPKYAPSTQSPELSRGKLSIDFFTTQNDIEGLDVVFQLIEPEAIAQDPSSAVPEDRTGCNFGDFIAKPSEFALLPETRFYDAEGDVLDRLMTIGPIF